MTCLCPVDGSDGSGLFGEELLRFQAEQTQVGRQCRGGSCAPACSRVAYAGLATSQECTELRERAEALLAYCDVNGGNEDDGEDGDVSNLDLSDAAESGDVRLALLLLRLIERLRRVVAHEYGLPPSRLVASTAFVARIRAASAERRRGRRADGSEAGVCVAHADESSYDSYHYSAVLHLHSVGDGFTGGSFVFTDPSGDPESDAAGASLHSSSQKVRRLTRLEPQAGRALLFSSGWENAHYVEDVHEGGTRYALPVFFRTAEDAPDDIGFEIARELCKLWSGGEPSQ